MPAAAVVIPDIVGFCNDDVKPSGPLHDQLTAIGDVAAPARLSVAPAHIGLGVAPAVTADGTTLTVTIAVVLLVVPHALVTSNE